MSYNEILKKSVLYFSREFKIQENIHDIVFDSFKHESQDFEAIEDLSKIRVNFNKIEGINKIIENQHFFNALEFIKYIVNQSNKELATIVYFLVIHSSHSYIMDGITDNLHNL